MKETFDYERKHTKPPTLPRKVETPPLAVSDMIPRVPEPDYNSIKKVKRGNLPLAAVAAIQKSYATQPPAPPVSKGAKPPSTEMQPGWGGGK